MKLITKPETVCPRCGGRLAAVDVVDVRDHAETVVYYAECGCGAANLTVTAGRIAEITPRDPVDPPDYEDFAYNDREYMDCYYAMLEERG